MKLYLLPILLMSVGVSCSAIPELGLDDAGQEEAPALSKYGEAHQTFLKQPNYKKLIYRNEELIKQLNSENTRITVSLSALRARVLLGEEVAIDTPVSPGKKTHPTPTGDFSIIGKKKDHRSNLYGTIYDEQGGWVAGGDRRKTTIPEGGKFVGTPMPYWMRLTNTGIGMHVGYVPTYPASHGCIRLPKPIAPTIFQKTKVGTPVKIED